jgi:hypothetical protein
MHLNQLNGFPCRCGDCETERVEMKNTTAKDKLTKLEERVEAAKQELKAAEAALKAFWEGKG